MKTIANFSHMSVHRRINHTKTKVTITQVNTPDLVLSLQPLEGAPDTTDYMPFATARSVFALGIDASQTLHLLHFGHDQGWSRCSKDDMRKFVQWHHSVMWKNTGNGDIQIGAIHGQSVLNEAFFALYPDLIYPTNTQILKMRMEDLLQLGTHVEWNNTFRALGKFQRSWLLQTDDVKVYWVNGAQREVVDLTALFHSTETRELLNSTLTGGKRRAKKKEIVAVANDHFKYPGLDDSKKFSSLVYNRNAMINDFFSHNLEYVRVAQQDLHITKTKDTVGNSLAQYTIFAQGTFGRVTLSRDIFEMLQRHLLGMETNVIRIVSPTAEAYYTGADNLGLYIRSLVPTKRQAVTAEDAAAAAEKVAAITGAETITTGDRETAFAPHIAQAMQGAATTETQADVASPVSEWEYPGVKDDAADWGSDVLIARDLPSVDIREFLMPDKTVFTLGLGGIYNNVLWELAQTECATAARMLQLGQSYLVSRMNETLVCIDDVVYRVPMHVNPSI